MEFKIARIHINGVNIHSYFFSPDEIEFDIDPREINNQEDFEVIKNFMISVSKLLSKEITLTDENTPEVPFTKIHTENGIYKILTKDEYKFLYNSLPPFRFPRNGK